MNTIKKWLDTIDAEKIDENNYYIGDYDLQINKNCVICNVNNVQIDEHVILFLNNNNITATFLADEITNIGYN